ncbi:MAG: pyruvate carboxyltransferase [Thermodesulfobacteriota bacterium]
MMQIPGAAVLADTTLRDGLQHEERFVATDAKVWLAEQLVLAGCRRLEVTNYGNPRRMPQFRDADRLLKALRASKILGPLAAGVELTAVTIREQAVERAIQARRDGYGPDRLLLMVATSDAYQRTSSGLSAGEYWRMCERYLPQIRDAGMKVCGAVTTIWGCPLQGRTETATALEFTRRWLELGAGDVEHADHDGSATPDRVYEYFSELLQAFPEPHRHVAHFHTTRGWGLANVLAALQAGMHQFEASLGGIGGQPATLVDGVPVPGVGASYSADDSVTGLVSTEDLAAMLDGMEVATGLDLGRLLETGRTLERILGRRLRSESVRSGPRCRDRSGRQCGAPETPAAPAEVRP